MRFWDHYCKLGVLFLAVIIIRALLFGTILGPLIFGNSHAGATVRIYSLVTYLEAPGVS